jgi:hypothetical protein
MKRQPTRSAPTRERERDLKDMLAQLRRTEARVAEAVVTVLRRADSRTLIAFGVLLEFVVRQRGRRPR